MRKIIVRDESNWLFGWLGSLGGTRGNVVSFLRVNCGYFPCLVVVCEGLPVMSIEVWGVCECDG